MIQQKDNSEVAVLGEVQKYKVSIDERNLQYIVTILSSNLYSHPMQSFLREIVSNAVDSHLEAGVNEPIIITITDNDLSIRDFGTGISPERFQEIFINIGSSTKRDSNEYIGSFGLGRFSSLSVSGVVNITSFYHGKASYYVMNKDVDQLHIDLLFEKDTNEHDGVEVKIPFKSALDSEDWKTLSYIKNVYIEDARKYVARDSDNGMVASSFNKRKIHAFKTFKFLEIGYPFTYSRFAYTRVLVGNIPYRVDYSLLWDDKLHDDWQKTFNWVCPIINIGDVDITPNREELLYSERTKKCLREAYDNAINEISELWDKSCNDEKNDFYEFMDAMVNHYSNYLKVGYENIPLPNALPYKVKYKDFDGYDTELVKRVLTKLYNYQTNNVVTIYDGYYNQLRKGKSVDSFTVRRLMESCFQNNTLIEIPSSYGFSSKYIKGFLTKEFGKEEVIILRKIGISPYKVRNFFTQTFGISLLSNPYFKPLMLKLLRETFDWFKQHVKAMDIIHSKEFLQYKEDNKENTKYVRDNTKMTFHVWSSKTLRETVCTATPQKLMHDLRIAYKKERIVYAGLYSTFTTALLQIGYPNLVIIELSQDNLKLADNGLFPDWVRPIEEIYSPNDRHLRRMATLRSIKAKYGYISNVNSLPIQENIKEMARKLERLDAKYRNSNFPKGSSYEENLGLLDVVPEENYDREILALHNMTKKWMDLEKKLDAMSLYPDNYFFYLLMKKKLMRIDYHTYNKVKSKIQKICESLDVKTA